MEKFNTPEGSIYSGKTKKELQLLTKNAMNEVLSSFESQLENMFVHGLARHNFFFEDQKELREFAEKRCRAHKVDKETTYYFDEIPFLVYTENTDINYNFETSTASFNFGEYKFL